MSFHWAGVLKKCFFVLLFSLDLSTEASVDGGVGGGDDFDQSPEDFDQLLSSAKEKQEEEEADLNSEENDDDDDDDSVAGGVDSNVFFKEILSQPELERPEPEARLADPAEPDSAVEAEEEDGGEDGGDDDDVDADSEDDDVDSAYTYDEEEETEDESQIFVRTGAAADDQWPVVNYPKAIKRLERAAVVARKQDSKSLKKRKKSNPRNPEDQRYIDFLESNRADIVGLAKDGFNDMGAELQRLAKLMKKKDEQHAADMAFIRDQLDKLQQTANVSQASGPHPLGFLNPILMDDRVSQALFLINNEGTKSTAFCLKPPIFP